MNRWCRLYDRCVQCGKADSPHAARGTCARCYAAEYRKIYVSVPGGPHLERAKQLFRRGMNGREVARALGISKSRAYQLVGRSSGRRVKRICDKCKRAFMGTAASHACKRCLARSIKYKPCPTCGRRMQETSKHCWRCAPRANRKADPVVARELRRTGLSYRKIAKRLQCTPMAVWFAVKRPISNKETAH